MFNTLTERFQTIIKDLRGRGKLTEANIRESLRQIRRALLEADVNYKVAKEFISGIAAEAVGTRVMKSLTPGHQVVKIVHEKLIELMGKDPIEIELPDNRLNKIMLVGLQGSGKTTTCAKLAGFFRNNRIKPMLAACDIHRPAAVNQLEILGRQLDMQVFSLQGSRDVQKIAKLALKKAEKDDINLIVFDTAGRLHIDSEMMKEVRELKKTVKPDYLFFVADAMTGQDAVNVAAEFNDQLSMNGVILTKMDGDARGGAALSIKAVTGKPIVFTGTGEKISDLELFKPESMAGRILGMGDMLSFIEKAQQNVDLAEAEEAAKKLAKNRFDFNDFLSQLHQLKKMGSMENLLGMLPGMNTKALAGVKLGEKDLKHIEAIIFSMTPTEREKPLMINGSRRHRIARGSGTSIQQVNRLIKQFEQMKKMMKRFNNKNLMKLPGLMG